MKLRTHTCRAASCQHVVSVRMLMCLDHWRMVPAPMRREVLETWKARRAVGGLDQVAAHNAAVDKAIAAVKEKQERKAAATAGPSERLFP